MEVSGQSQRWQGQRSAFSWEQSALAHIKGQMPDAEHRRHLCHRALAPRSVYVELDGNYPRLRIADWQVAARPGSTTGGPSGTRATSTQLPGGAAALLAHIERSAGAYLAPEFDVPESPALLDVFGLGALSYLILTGQAPAVDVDDYIKSCHILEYGSYHVVVANPPYITVKDKAENESIRVRYQKSCSGKYALSSPFAERIFALAVHGSGYTGQITPNSFMKREFGKNLVEEFFPSTWRPPQSPRGRRSSQ